MVDLIPPQTVLTQADAASAFNTSGLDVLGLTMPFLSPVWATAAASATLDAQRLTMTFALPAGASVCAPFRGILSFEGDGSRWSEVDGRPIVGMVAVLALHPEAQRRLQRLIDARHGAAAMIAAPAAMLIRHLPTPAVIPVPNWYRAGEPLAASMQAGTPMPAPQPVVSVGGGGTTVSFHDTRGLPIDPVAVACLFLDLFTFADLAALRLFDAGVPASGIATATVGLTSLAGLATGDRVQVIDPHGWPFRSAAGTLALQADATKTIDASGLIDLPAKGALVRGPGDDVARPIRFGWARGGTLGSQPLAAPVAAVPLGRRFLRCMAVDLAWHLLGNRSAAAVPGVGGRPAVPADDGQTPAFALPRVRTAVPNFAYLPDAMAVLGAMGDAAAGFGGTGIVDRIALIASPQIDPALAVPVPAGQAAAAHWPAFPPGSSTPGQLTTRIDLRGKVTAARSAASAADVVVTIAPGALPADVHVRVHPRRFVEIASIEPGVPSFVRGDGAAALTGADGSAVLLLVRPSGTDAAPDPVVVDLVATDRGGTRRLFSQFSLTLGGPQPPPAAPAFGGTPILTQGALADPKLPLFRSVAPTPLFGIPGPGMVPGGVTDLKSLLTAMTSEGQPRQGPRLPTQARFDTVLALGQRTAAQPQLQFRAVLSGARLAPESRSRRPDLGDPGNPAGPDVHAVGIACDGPLAYDLAFHALKRTLPVGDLPASGSLGWAAQSGGDNWNAPAEATAGPVSAAMLETVAYGVDTPELGLAPFDPAKPIPSLSSLPPSITITLGNEAQILPRLDREIATSRSGQRDALWSLARAFSEARELVYVETAAFARTGRAGASAPHDLDLVETLRAAMTANTRLKLIVCVPRMPDFATPAHPNWELTALALRREALASLIGDPALSGRVAAFHPVGFPGRDAAIRSTAVVVDDVYALVGSSHLRRRGMTFDGACDVASIDRSMAGGYSGAIAAFRQQAMAAKLGVEALATGADALWIRLASPEGAFAAIADLLAEGGGGRIAPIWAGPSASGVLPADENLVDPDGGPGGTDLFTLFKSFLQG